MSLRLPAVRETASGVPRPQAIQVVLGAWNPALHAKGRALEELRWRLVAVTRRAATDDLDAAA